MKSKKQAYYRETLPHFLLISGSGRNCGKTSLACAIIKNQSEIAEVFALKISPHFHQLDSRQELIYNCNNFRIFKETDNSTNKDSSRMLNAGATSSIYLQCEDKYITEALESLKMIIPDRTSVVCESGSLANYFRPGLHLLVESEFPDKMKRSYQNNKVYADQIVHFDGLEFGLKVGDISFRGEKWLLKNVQNDQISRRA